MSVLKKLNVDIALAAISKMNSIALLCSHDDESLLLSLAFQVLVKGKISMLRPARRNIVIPGTLVNRVIVKNQKGGPPMA